MFEYTQSIPTIYYKYTLLYIQLISGIMVHDVPLCTSICTVYNYVQVVMEKYAILIEKCIYIYKSIVKYIIQYIVQYSRYTAVSMDTLRLNVLYSIVCSIWCMPYMVQCTLYTVHYTEA